MRKLLSTLIILCAVSILAMMDTAKAATQAKPAVTKTKPIAAQNKTTVNYIKVTPNMIVDNPSLYLNKKVEITGKFDKFSTLGLDYKKAMRESTKYIAFLMQRDDVQDHNVPLSELKLFLKREYAEKFIDLNTNDVIKVRGTVFSNALGDGWADIDSIEIVSKAQDKK